MTTAVLRASNQVVYYRIYMPKNAHSQGVTIQQEIQQRKRVRYNGNTVKQTEQENTQRAQIFAQRNGNRNPSRNVT